LKGEREKARVLRERGKPGVKGGRMS